MSLPTEAELFADLIEYRAVLEVLRSFNTDHVVTIRRISSSQPSGVSVRYLVTIGKTGFWNVASEDHKTLQQAAEQARDRALKETENESLLKQTKDAISVIISQQTDAEFYKMMNKGTGV